MKYKINKKNKEIFYSGILLLVPLLTLFSIYFISISKSKETEKTTNRNSASMINSITTEFKVNPYDDIEITARSAIVKDINTGEVIYQKNADLPLPLASITKVMTAVVAEKLYNQKNNKIVITQESITRGEGGIFFRIGEIFNFQDLMNFMLITSANDGAAAIAESIQHSNPGTNFISQMNSVAKEIGMTNTFFVNETGLDEDMSKAGAIGTAKDVSVLFEYALKNYPEILEATTKINLTKRSETGFIHTATNTNSAIPQLKNLLASKTGFTDLAGGNLAVIVDPGLNRPISIVVLGSTKEGRFQDVLKLSDLLTEYFNNY